jgi:ketosteroid isomerase-like protein
MELSMKLHNGFTVVDTGAIEAIIIEFGYLVDAGRAGECPKLFASDAQLVFGEGSPKPGTVEGSDAIRSYFTTRQAAVNVMTRHIMTNIRLESKPNEKVEASYFITLYRSEDGSRKASVAMLADVVDVFGRDTDGGWIMQHMTVTPFLSRV